MSWGEVVTDIALAYEWLYGDLVHADADAALRVGAHDLNDRYRAGAILISNVAMRVVATLNLVRALRDRGLLELPDEPFAQAVTADPGAALTVRNVAHLAVGATTDELEAALDTQRAAGQPMSISDLRPSPVSPPPAGGQSA